MASTDEGASFSLAAVPALADALASGRLLVLAGAGISRLGPSFLPDWFGFNRAILEEAKACASRGIPGLDAQAQSALQGLAIEQIPVEAFSDLVVRSFASEGYFTVLDVLDSEQSNANHQALATLAKRGLLHTIATTNFDTLIERAFRDADVPLDVVTAASLSQGSVGAGLNTLYKVHGSVTAVDTLVDTVSQKLRGLPAPLRERLGQLYRTHHVLVLGYSGGDLRFGNDYLGLSSIDAASPGFTWVLRPNSKPADAVVALRDRVGARGAIVTAALPGFFRALGIDVPIVSAEDEQAAKRAAEERAATRIRQFFEEPYVGSLSSAAFCANMLSRLGRRDAATVLRSALAAEAESWGTRVPKTAAGVFRTIASGRMAEGDVDGAARWTGMEIAFWEAAKAYFPEATTPPDTLATWQRNMAAARMNLAVVHRARGQFDNAFAALKLAIELADAAAHPGLRATVYREAATLAWQADEDRDTVIGLWRGCISAAVEDGWASKLADTLLGLADVLLQLGEYDLAWTEVDRAAKQLPLAVNPDAVERIEIVRADVEARRGNASGALKRLGPLVEAHPADTPRGARVRAALARFIGFHTPRRPLALAMLDDVIAAMQTGRLPERGLSDVPEREELTALRGAISDGGGPAIAALIRVPGQDEEALLRGQLVLAEMTGFQPIIPMAYERLCRMKRAQGRWLRVLDLAQGLLHASRRAGDVERELAAINFYGLGFAATGNVETAIAQFEACLTIAAPGRQRDAIAQNLNVLRQGTVQPLAEVLSSPEVDNPLSPRDAVIWAGARALLDQNDLDGALLVLLQAREATA
jgi:tetratricopeptide (TPR) repeat protein